MHAVEVTLRVIVDLFAKGEGGYNGGEEDVDCGREYPAQSRLFCGVEPGLLGVNDGSFGVKQLGTVDGKGKAGIMEAQASNHPGAEPATCPVWPALRCNAVYACQHGVTEVPACCSLAAHSACCSHDKATALAVYATASATHVPLHVGITLSFTWASQQPPKCGGFSGMRLSKQASPALGHLAVG